MRIALFLAAIATALPATAQFTMQTSNTTADLRGIHNVGNGVAWASGTHGTVLRTEDGGYVWQSCSIPPGAENLDFRGVQAFDANTAIVMSSGPGDQSRLYETADGCHSWKLLFTNPDKEGFWDAVKAVTSQKIVILGDPVDGQFPLFETVDGGKNWNRRHDDLGLHSERGEAIFAASNSSLLFLDSAGKTAVFGTGGPSGSRMFVECSACDSRDFVAHSAPFPKSQSAGTFSVAARNSHVLVAVGGDYAKPDDASSTAAYSIDGALNWTNSTAPPHGYRSAVAYDAATKTWISAGPNGTDISTDDGRNWRPVHPDAALHEPADSDRNWNALSLPFVVGPKGRIGKIDAPALKP